MKPHQTEVLENGGLDASFTIMYLKCFIFILCRSYFPLDQGSSFDSHVLQSRCTVTSTGPDYFEHRLLLEKLNPTTCS